MRSLSERQRSAQCYSLQELQEKNHLKAMAIYKLEGRENADDKDIVGSGSRTQNKYYKRAVSKNNIWMEMMIKKKSL